MIMMMMWSVRPASLFVFSSFLFQLIFLIFYSFVFVGLTGQRARKTVRKSSSKLWKFSDFFFILLLFCSFFVLFSSKLHKINIIRHKINIHSIGHVCHCWLRHDGARQDQAKHWKSLKYSGVQNTCTERTNLSRLFYKVTHLDLIWRGRKCVLAIGWEMSYN